MSAVQKLEYLHDGNEIPLYSEMRDAMFEDAYGPSINEICAKWAGGQSFEPVAETIKDILSIGDAIDLETAARALTVVRVFQLAWKTLAHIHVDNELDMKELRGEMRPDS